MWFWFRGDIESWSNAYNATLSSDTMGPLEEDGARDEIEIDQRDKSERNRYLTRDTADTGKKKGSARSRGGLVGGGGEIGRAVR